MSEAPERLSWSVYCKRHQERAHLEFALPAEQAPHLEACSLKPGQFPPTCDQACMQQFALEPPEADPH